MKELTWKPILSNLTEALGEIRDLHERLHFLQFGELPEEEEPSPGDDSDAGRWNRFPDTAAFADLWPSDRSVKGRRHH